VSLSQEGRLLFNGEADINVSWLKELKEAPTCPHRVKRDDTGPSFPKMQILPRFLVEGWDLDGYQALFAPKSALAKKFIDLLVSTVRKLSFDGLVLDAGYLNARAPWREHLIAVMRSLGAALHKENKLFVLVIPVRLLRSFFFLYLPILRVQCVADDLSSIFQLGVSRRTHGGGLL